MDKSKPRRSSDFAQRDAARRLGLDTLPDPIRLADAAALLAAGDAAAGFRWVDLLRAAVDRGELPAILEPVPAKPATPWHRDPRPLDAQLRRPAQGAPGFVIKRLALANLRAWLESIGADVPEWLPTPKPDKTAAGLARHGLTARQERDCKAAARALCEAEHAAGRVLSIDALAERCLVDGRPAPTEWVQPIARLFWPDGAPRGRKRKRQ